MAGSESDSESVQALHVVACHDATVMFNLKFKVLVVTVVVVLVLLLSKFFKQELSTYSHRYMPSLSVLVLRY